MNKRKRVKGRCCNNDCIREKINPNGFRDVSACSSLQPDGLGGCPGDGYFAVY